MIASFNDSHIRTSCYPAIHYVFIINDKIYAPNLMSSTVQAVKNAATALKKAADPWNKEGRETAERIVSAAISVVNI